MNDDWRYSDEKMKLRQQALTILLSKFGGELDSTRKSKYANQSIYCLLYTSPSPRDISGSRMPSSA